VEKLARGNKRFLACLTELFHLESKRTETMHKYIMKVVHISKIMTEIERIHNVGVKKSVLKDVAIAHLWRESQEAWPLSLLIVKACKT